MSQTPSDRRPYVGPGPFEEGETLYGRDDEKRDLTYLLRAERVVLLHAPSGAGKTSLIRAGLIPKLEEARFDVLPIVVLSRSPTKPDVNPKNRYVFSTLLSLELRWPEASRIEEGDLAEMTLPQYLRERVQDASDTGNRDRVLIFDQFEELFTLDPTDEPEKIEFLQQVAEVLSPPASSPEPGAESEDDVYGSDLAGGRRERCPYWALFAIRDDYLAALDPYKLIVPTRFSNRFRLGLLRREAALDAVIEPPGALEPPVEFERAAAQALVDDLRETRVQKSAGAPATPEPGPTVEPVHLQVVCKTIWDSLDADVPRIDADVLAQVRRAGGGLDADDVSNVDVALQRYYSAQVARTADDTDCDVDERTIRDWFENELITEQGTRTQIGHAPGHAREQPGEVPARLIESYLVRCERERGAPWYTLAHDRLIEPVRASNAAWRREHLTDVQLQALKWDATDRPDDMLLRGRELADGLRWAADPENTPTATESSFLATSRAKRTRARLKVATPVLVAFLLIVVVASYNALKQRAKIQQLEGERVVMDLRKTNQALEVAEASLERTKEERDDATGRARNLQSTVDGLTTRLAQTTDRLTQTQAALDSQTAKRATERERIVSAVAKARRDVGSPLRHPLAIGDPERTVRWVILHHTKVPTGAQYRSYGGVATLRGIYAYRLFQDNSVRLPYHYLVAPDGAIWPALDIKTPIEDVPKWAEAVHVGLVLDGDQGRAYTKQREATGELLRALLTRVVRRDPTPDPEGIVKLCGGCEWGGTHCPGERIRLSEVLKWIPKLRSTEPREQPAD